ncbi:MAG TPA: GNAT family N-acetyltransferase [Bacilli bacterium]|nr:GNAT family N-acetyltransferase [Bacilli bacterium]
MHFHGEALPEPEIGWRLYEDGDFDEYVERYSDGFYELRKSIGEKPYAVKEKKCEEWRQQNLANRKNLYVFFKPGQDMTPSNLIGSALIRPDGWLDDLFVIPSLHGQGYGRKITQCMVNRCLERGLSPVSLDVVSTNTSAVQLYERLGFVVEQENTSGYGRIRK